MFLNPKRILNEIRIFKFNKIAEFGIGSGAFSEELYWQLDENGELFLFDIDPLFLKRVQNSFKENENINLEKIHFIETNLEKKEATKLKNESVDFILISQILFQSKNPEKILKEAFRILKKNEKILIIDWKDSFKGIGPQEEFLIDEEKLEKILKNFSYNLERKIKAGNYHYAWLIRKKA